MFRTWMKMATLAWDSQQVIAMRLTKLAKGGPAAAIEANQMVAEKVMEAGKSAMTLASGGSMNSVLGSYHKKVQANKRRLKRR